MNQFLQNVIFFYILKNPALAMKCRGEFFDATYLKILFDILKPFALQYKECPTFIQAVDLVKSEGKDNVVPVDAIEMIYQHLDKLSQYEEDWLESNVKAWLTWSNTMRGLRTTIGYVKTISPDITIENYQEINEKIKTIFNSETQMTFDDDEGSDFFNPEEHQVKNLKRTSTGYPFLDLCSKGGYWKGSLWCLAGAPKVGKSIWLQNLCAKSVSAGHDSAYISLELQVEMINQRIGANLFNISTYDYDKVVADTEAFKQKIKAYFDSLLITPGKLWVKEFPTSSASVFDLEAALLKKEEQLSLPGKPFKFKNIFVDYINILKNYRNPNSENTYLKIKQLAEDLRAMAQRNNWCVITATQTNRAQAGAVDMGYSSIGESYGLISTVDMLFGIIRDVAMQANGEYYLKIIANRATDHMEERKKFLLEKSYLRIEEDKSSPIINDAEIVDELAKGTWNKPKTPGVVIDAKSGNNNGNMPQLNVPPQSLSQADLLATELVNKNLFNL